jgi:hypothetical protein
MIIVAAAVSVCRLIAIHPLEHTSGQLDKVTPYQREIR